MRRIRSSKFTKSRSSLTGWILWSCFSRKVLCLVGRERLIRYGGNLLISDCPRSKSCINVHFLDHTCSVSILKQWSHFWRSCMREFMKVIQGAGHYPMGPLPRGTDGQVCKKKYWSMWRSVINVKDLLQTFISQGVSSILCLVHGHFAQQGLDIVGPFPKAAGNWRWHMIGTNYFTKWVEAKPLSNIRDLDAKKFVWKNIVTQFGIPQTLISDNGL